MGTREVLLSFLFLLLLLILPIVGVYMLFYTDKAINFVMQIYDKINIYGIEPYWDPRGSFVISLYKIGGVIFIMSSICTLLLMAWAIITIIFGGGRMCFGSVDNCQEF